MIKLSRITALTLLALLFAFASSVSTTKACAAFCALGFCWQVDVCPPGTVARCYCVVGNPICGCFAPGGHEGEGSCHGLHDGVVFEPLGDCGGIITEGSTDDQQAAIVMDVTSQERAVNLHPEATNLLLSLSEIEVREMIENGLLIKDGGTIHFTVDFFATPYVEIVIQTEIDRMVISKNLLGGLEIY